MFGLWVMLVETLKVAFVKIIIICRGSHLPPVQIYNAKKHDKDDIKKK